MMKYLTTHGFPSITLPQVRDEVLQEHRAVGGVIAPIVHLAASATNNDFQSTVVKLISYCVLFEKQPDTVNGGGSHAPSAFLPGSAHECVVGVEHG